MTQAQQITTGTFTGIVAILIAVPVLFYNTTWSMIDVWIVNETFTHGFLILPISLWLIWRRKNEVNQYRAAPDPRLLILLAPILSIWLLGNIAGVQVVQQLAMVALIPIVVWLLYGRDILLALLFPMLYLFFAVPLGQSLIPPMMELTAHSTVKLIILTGIPVYQDGLSFTLPSGSWSVVEECSGVRYLIASLALGTIYAYLTYASNLKRSVFILVAILVPIIANGLRAFGIVMIGHYSNMELATGADHLLYGWLFFGIVIFTMFYIGSFWSDPVASHEEKRIHPRVIENTPPIRPFKVLVLVAILSILSINLFAYMSQHNNKATLIDIELSLPESFEEWLYDSDLSLNWKPEIINPDVSLSRIYNSENDIVQLDIGFYRYQRSEAEAITTQNRLTDPYEGDWKIIDSTDIKDQGNYVAETVIQKAGQKLLIWNWYRIGQQQTSDRYVAKAYEAYNRIFLGRKEASIISMATTLKGDRDESRSKIRNFRLTASKDINKILESVSTNQ